jgi:hypothetical protein
MTDFALIRAVPSGSANGTPLPNVPYNASGVVLYLAPASTAPSISYAIASAQPASAPTAATVTGQTTASQGRTLVVTESLNPGQNLYVTAVTGTVLFRWLQGG